MHRSIYIAALAVLMLGVARVASAQLINYDFEDNTDQGWGTGFGSNDASATFTIVTDGAPGNGSKYMRVPVGGFQVAAADSNPPALVAAGNAAAAAPALYQLSYDWFVDTAPFAANPPTFMQLGSFINDGAGYYAQDFGPEAQLNGTQLASGGKFSGHVDVNYTVFSPDQGTNNLGPIGSQATQTFWRVGLIENGNNTLAVDYDNISIHPIPEPASLGLLGLALPALALRRRHSA